MPADQQIIQYLQTISGGVINITAKQAIEIIAIATGSRSAIAKYYRWDMTKGHGKGDWEFLRDISTTNQAIDSAITKVLATGPQHGFYKYECFNDQQQFEGIILTIHNNLF